jgi:hypothetical protein
MAVAATAALVFTGCVAGTSASAATVDPLTRVDSVSIAPSGFVLLHGTTKITTVPDTTTSTAVATLTKVLGKPKVVAGKPGDGTNVCTAIPTTYTWGSGLRISDKTRPKQKAFGVAITKRIIAGRTRAAVILEGPKGQKVGDNSSALIANAPSSQRYKIAYSNPVSYQVLLAADAGSTTKAVFGVVATTKGAGKASTIVRIDSHFTVGQLDGC